VDGVSQQLMQRIKELADRYATALPQLLDDVSAIEARVNHHLGKMGFRWN
jgi:type I restriction enzyme M protein